MGTHNYRLQFSGVGKRGEFSHLNFTMIHNRNTKDVTYAELYPEKYTYTRDVGCRERIMDFLREIGFFYRNKDRQYVMGIRCYGFMHARIARLIMEGDVQTNIMSLEEFFLEVFGIPVRIEVGATDPAETNSKHNGRIQTTYPDKNEKLVTETHYEHITLYFESKLTQGIPLTDAKISAMIALLREPRIITRILDDRIDTVEKLALELFRISYARMTRMDISYECYAFFSGNTPMMRTHQENIKSIKDVLKHARNTDGSDFESILFLAVFVLYANYSKDKSILTSHSGPSSFARNSAGPVFLRKIPSLVGENKIFQKFGEYVGSNFISSGHVEEVAGYWVKS